jgi:hypothetical protein
VFASGVSSFYIIRVMDRKITGWVVFFCGHLKDKIKLPRIHGFTQIKPQIRESVAKKSFNTPQYPQIDS